MAEEEEVLRTSFSDRYSDTINGLTRTHAASHTSVTDNLEGNFNVIECIMEANDSQAHNDLPVPLSTLEISKEQKYNCFCQLILALNTEDFSSGFHAGENGLLRCRQPSTPGIQQIVISKGLRGKLCTITHHHKLVETSGVTQLHANLQQTCY